MKGKREERSEEKRKAGSFERTRYYFCVGFLRLLWEIQSVSTTLTHSMMQDSGKHIGNSAIALYAPLYPFY